LCENIFLKLEKTYLKKRAVYRPISDKDIKATLF